MKESWRSISDTFRNTLFNVINKEFLTFLVFLAISTAFWFSTALNETYEKEIAVPLVISDVPKNIIITDGLPDTIRVTVRDKGYSLLSYFYGDKIGTVKVPFGVFSKPTGKGTVTAADLQKLVYPKLYASTKITAVKSDRWDFYFNYGISKKVPVFLDGQIKSAEQYYLAHTKFSEDSILIYASRAMLDSITEVYTEELNIDELKDTLSRTIVLKKIRGVKMEPDRVKVTLFPDMLTEMTINVPITPVNTPDGYILRTFPSSVNVRVVVGRSKLALVKISNFKVAVDYNEVVNHPSDKCTLFLRIIPKGITSATLETNQVDYLIEKVE